jgi:hypothetical protein
MQILVPSPLPLPDFTPVPRKFRIDGWTDERQRAFVAALAETGSVRSACKRINMAATGAYQLRLHPEAESFRAAWDAALAHGVQDLADIAMQRAREGVAVPVFYKGEQCGEHRKYNDKLLMFILRHHLPHLYGKLAELPPGARAQAALGHIAAEEAKAEAEQWLQRHLRAFVSMAVAHRVHLRQAVLALLIGDHWGAADHEHKASEIEKTISTCPDEWEIVGALSGYELERTADDPLARPDHLEYCRPLADAPGDGVPDPDFACLADLPRSAQGTVIPGLPISPAIRKGRYSIRYGPTVREREQARRGAEQRMHEAQLEWIAAYSEEDWEEWSRREGVSAT